MKPIRPSVAVLLLVVAAPCRTDAGEDKEKAEKELARVVSKIPRGFHPDEMPRILDAGEKPDTEQDWEARIRTARMTSGTTAKITVTYYYLYGKVRWEQSVFIHLTWYNSCWTVKEFSAEGHLFNKEGGWRPDVIKLITYIDDVGGEPLLQNRK